MSQEDDETPEPITATAPVPLRRNRSFQMLWIGQVLSDLGSGFGALAYPLLILALTHSPVLAGAVGTIASLCAFIVRLPAGALADRLDRRKTMMACDGVRTLVLAVLAVAVVLHAIARPSCCSWPSSTVSATRSSPPRRWPALPSIVVDEQLQRGMGRNRGAAIRRQPRRPCTRRRPLQPRPGGAVHR